MFKEGEAISLVFSPVLFASGFIISLEGGTLEIEVRCDLSCSSYVNLRLPVII